MEKDIQKQRERFFWIQSGILGFLLIVTIFTFLAYNRMEVEKGIKIFFAPFLSVVPLVFALTIIKDWITRFMDQDYPRAEIIRYSIVGLITAAIFTFITKMISMITATEMLIAVMIAIISLLSFISIKVRDILGMSIITGVAEGIIIYMVFFF
ncbi:MAG: hypothetical protein JW894_16505 [Bacteroidales bacterium]|nr:hypothetical protein [Bacteroidales bacterium]